MFLLVSVPADLEIWMLACFLGCNTFSLHYNLISFIGSHLIVKLYWSIWCHKIARMLYIVLQIICPVLFGSITIYVFFSKFQVWLYTWLLVDGSLSTEKFCRTFPNFRILLDCPPSLSASFLFVCTVLVYVRLLYLTYDSRCSDDGNPINGHF